MERESRETWAKRVERWKDSGLTAKEYAAEVGVNAHSLSWWRWRLSSGAAGAPKARRQKRARQDAAAMTFVEVPATAVAEAIEVVLPSSIRIRVPAGFDAGSLGRLLEVLDARR